MPPHLEITICDFKINKTCKTVHLPTQMPRAGVINGASLFLMIWLRFKVTICDLKRFPRRISHGFCGRVTGWKKASPAWHDARTEVVN